MPWFASSSIPVNQVVVEVLLYMTTETTGLLGMGVQDGHLNFHTAPEFSVSQSNQSVLFYTLAVHQPSFMVKPCYMKCTQ